MNLRKNILATYVGQFVNGLLSLVLVALSVRVLGFKTWGQSIYLLTIANYFSWFVNWSFYLTGTRSIALQRRKNFYFLLQWYSQAIIFASIIALFYFFCVLFSFKLDYLFFYLIVSLTTLLTPFWYLQGVKNFQSLWIFQAFPKGMLIINLFFYKKLSLNYYLFIYAISFFIVSVYFFIWMIRKYNLKFMSISLSKVFWNIKNGFIVFLGSLTWSSFYSLPTLMVGHFLGPHSLGIYSALEKIKNLITLSFNPLIQAVFPEFSRIMGRNLLNKKKFFINFLFFFLIFGALSSLLLFIFSNAIVLNIFGRDFIEAVPLLKVFAFSSFFYILCNFLNYNFLIANNRFKLFLILTLISTFTNLTLISFSIFILQSLKAVVFSIVFSEFIYFMLLMKSLNFSARIVK